MYGVGYLGIVVCAEFLELLVPFAPVFRFQVIDFKDLEPWETLVVYAAYGDLEWSVICYPRVGEYEC